METTPGASNFDQVGARWGSWIIPGLKRAVRDWYELHRRNNTTNILVWTIYLELMLMAVLLILLPFDTVQVGGRYRLIKPLNFALSMALYRDRRSFAGLPPDRCGGRRSLVGEFQSAF